MEEIKSGNVIIGLRGGDLGKLQKIVAGCPGVVSATARDTRVVAELKDDDIAAVNEFIAEQGVYLSHLAREERTLEDVFMELTGAGASGGMGEVD